ncbi:major facilitator superfamily domain-containing protein [Halteromyces radiatus]|uniref:major facilitator superfamily domain-containing protein n=1 Tax=Halteromyces radiatus TaxID=101107 RepID=UPI0022200184|nr:major facilitator superfamily domain-containing protein [Halteromyces radiatus]KAI8078699.1 major facilitator superfamily domain-containing protein [Halteromyces radiatus]
MSITDEESSVQSTVLNHQTLQNEKEDPADEKDIDLANPQNWSSKKKLLNFIVVFCNSFISFFSSSIYVPAILSVQQYFHTSITAMNATIALYILISGVAPLFWAPLSERIGRKPTYILSMVLYTVFSVLCGVSRNLGMFFAFRLLQAVAASAAQAIGGGSVADMYNFQSRGKMMSIFLLGTVFGPVVGPIVGGYINLYLGWQWIFYIKTIIGGVISILNVVFLNESLYRPNYQPIHDESKSKFVNWWINFKFNPFSSLLLLLRIDVVLGCFPMAVAFGVFYCLVTILEPTFSAQYHFSSGSVGLSFLAGGTGNLLGALTSALILDRIHFRLIARKRVQLEQKGIEYHHGMLSELRLVPAPIPVICLVIGALFYGWFLEAKMVWIAPLIGMGLLGFGLFGLISTTTNYLVEGYVPQAAAMTSVGNFTRCLLGMVFSLLSSTIQASLGNGWTYTLLALIFLAVSAICLPLLMVFGYKWRTNPVWPVTK